MILMAKAAFWTKAQSLVLLISTGRCTHYDHFFMTFFERRRNWQKKGDLPLNESRKLEKGQKVIFYD